VCGSQEKLTNGHLFSRYSYSTRWDIQQDGNCHTQCWGCNFYHERDAYPYNNWFITKFGKERWDDLHAEYKAAKKFKTFELEEMYNDVKSKLEDLKKSKESKWVSVI